MRDRETSPADRFTLADCLAAGYCLAGCRQWFASTGRDFRDFARNGMSIEEAESLNDAAASHALDLKRRRVGGSDGE